MEEKSSGSFDFALEGLGLEKAWRRCAQEGRKVNILLEYKFMVL
jgi:hypothetical protein